MENKFLIKYPLCLIVGLCLLSFTLSEDIYQQPLKTIDGTKVDLHQYKGKKLLFIIVPLSGADTTVTISQMAQLQTRHESSLMIIGIPAEETGFKKGDEDKLKKLYKNMGSSFILSEAMKVNKGESQSSLFQWLTSKDRNQHFDKDVDGVGSKFFVDESGELYAVMGPQLKLYHPLMDKILSRAPAKK